MDYKPAMMSSDYRAWLARHQKSHDQAAAMLCAAARTSRAWASGERPVPAIVARILDLADANPWFMAWLEASSRAVKHDH